MQKRSLQHLTIGLYPIIICLQMKNLPLVMKVSFFAIFEKTEKTTKNTGGEEKAIELRPNLDLLAMKEREPEIIVYGACSPEMKKLFGLYKAKPLLSAGTSFFVHGPQFNKTPSRIPDNDRERSGGGEKEGENSASKVGR